MEYNNDFRYDLKLGQEKENEIGKALELDTIELKYDQQACSTGNVYIEVKSRNEWAGIATTQATHWVYSLAGECEGSSILIETNRLKEMVRKQWDKGQRIKGGDNNTSLGVLIPINQIFKPL